MEMEENSSFCANCGQLVQENEIVHHLTLDNSQFESTESDVMDIKRALNTIYNLDYIKNTQDEPEVVFVCGQCHPILHNLFKFYNQFNNLRQVNSFLDKQIQNLDSLLHQIESQNNNSPLKSKEDDDDDLMDDQDAVNLDQVKEEISSSEKDNLASAEDYYPSDQNDLTCDEAEEFVQVEIKAADSDDSQEDGSNSIDPLSIEKVVVTEKIISHKLTPPVDQVEDRSKKVECTLCQTMVSNKELLEHYRAHHRRGDSTNCLLCPNSFSSKKSLIAHLVVHVEDKPHHCRICGKGFAQTYSLKMHKRRHRKDRRYPCTSPGCHKAFYKSSDLKQHVEGVHFNSTDEIPYKCDVCGKGYRSKHSWYMHKNTHLDFQCPQCQRRFTTQLAHGEHVEKCEGRKSFICDSCGKIFAKKLSLDNHMRKHTGNVMTCPISNCGKTFTSKQGFDAHVLHHDKDKAFSCLDPNCSRKFGNKGNMKQHVCRKHPHLVLKMEVNVMG